MDEQIESGEKKTIGQRKNGYHINTINNENRVGKRMAYLLRYGAIRAGLNVDKEGYVEITDLLGTHLMRHHTEDEVLNEAHNSISFRGKKRYEVKTVGGFTYIRASYLRRFERSINHEGTNVPRLMESCLNVITANIKDYDLEDFWDEYLLNTIIHKLKRQKKLNNTAMRSILGPTIEHLDLEGVYITESTVKLITSRCPHLKFLSLKDSGFIMTDHLMQILLKKIPLLETLNLAGCKHLTDKTLQYLVRYNQEIQNLNIADLQLITQGAIINFLATAPSLIHLDIFFNRNITKEMYETIEEICRQRNITIVHKDFQDSEVGPSSIGVSLSKFRMGLV